MFSEKSLKYPIGQLVRHKIFDYRGVIIDVDDVFKESDEWYSMVAPGLPRIDRSWYHALMHGTSDRTYVSERNREPYKSDEPINLPEIFDFFLIPLKDYISLKALISKTNHDLFVDMYQLNIDV